MHSISGGSGVLKKIAQGRLNSKTVSLHSSGDLKFRIKAPLELVSGDVSPSSLQTLVSLLCPQMAFPQCSHREQDKRCLLCLLCVTAYQS